MTCLISFDNGSFSVAQIFSFFPVFVSRIMSLFGSMMTVVECHSRSDIFSRRSPWVARALSKAANGATKNVALSFSLVRNFPGWLTRSLQRASWRSALCRSASNRGTVSWIFRVKHGCSWSKKSFQCFVLSSSLMKREETSAKYSSSKRAPDRVRSSMRRSTHYNFPTQC